MGKPVDGVQFHINNCMSCFFLAVREMKDPKAEEQAKVVLNELLKLQAMTKE